MSEVIVLDDRRVARGASAAKRQNPILGRTSEGGEVGIDMVRLLESRMFVQAAPGAGKSYTVRRILEQTHHLIQQFVIDPEGELVTLAEKFDYLVLAADSDETPLREDTAATLAQNLWRSGHSVILSLDSMDLDEMQAFVAAFLRGLMATPKEVWAPLLISIDEAQLFAPQQDKSVSTKPMQDLAARGRKRGICPIIATQRASQLHKGVSAHLQNQLIGLTTQDIDVERCADLLGMKPARGAELLRSLQPGEFVTYGPALGHEVQTVKIGAVQTQHGMAERFGEQRRRRRQSKSRILAMVKELGAAPPPVVAGVDESSAGAPTGREAELLRVAEFRRWVIQPLLGRDLQRGDVAERARKLGLSYAEVSKWLTAFKNTYELADLKPLRVWESMRGDMVRLANVRLQEAAHQQPAPKAQRRAA